MDEHIAMPENVKITYKTGDYVGEVIDRDERRVLVKVLAVMKHPTQGDLHSSYDPDAGMFHERRALSYTEKVWVPINAVQPYKGTVPDYKESLGAAFELEWEKIDRLKRWSELCLEKLESLRKDYGK
ncbi:kinase-associated lipoprotein B [Cohnella mopanensis]|uniref:kinase-associated lipoprotein B n=1 Tax=Cohnella mopanensis TaxID=2911966 RepID=UPI001EF83DED|nr:kinase-associated lipoprotein B [Cohnella mopanensis]